MAAAARLVRAWIRLVRRRSWLCLTVSHGRALRWEHAERSRHRAAWRSITRTLTTFEWNAQEGRWKVVQHFPLAKGWDNTTKSYDPKEEVNFVGIPVD